MILSAEHSDAARNLQSVNYPVAVGETPEVMAAAVNELEALVERMA